MARTPPARRCPPLAVGLAAAVVLAFAGPGAAGAEEPSGLSASDNVRFVTNLAFDVVYPESSRLATDMDFLTTTVVERPGRGGGAGGVPHRVTRDFAFVGTYLNGLQVVDITDPESPTVVAVYDCAVAQADVFLFERPDLGRTFVAYSSDVIPGQTDSSGCHTHNGVEPDRYGTFIIDVTNPLDPRSVSFIEFPRGTHQVSVHPSGRWVYSSPSALVSDRLGEFHIADVTDPWNPGEPVAVPLDTGLDAHDIIFSADGRRAYVAALTHTLVVDTTDPGRPEVIGRILDPTITIHHEAHPFTTVDALTGIEHTFLLIVDEFAGAAGNEVCPGGGIHVYDITGHLERMPVKVGAFFAPEVGPVEGAGQGAAGLDRCTAHVLQIHPDRGIATVAWYALGTRVLDLSGLPRRPRAGGPDRGPTMAHRGGAGGTLMSWTARSVVLILVATLVLAAAPLAASDPVPSGGFSSDNVEWLGAVPIHTGTAGGKLVDDFYYLTDPRGVYVYDVSEPTAPELVGVLPALQLGTHVVFAQEEPDTNGEVLLLNAVHADGLEAGVPPSNGWLLVVDVSDKTNDPQVIGSLGLYDHTWTCILDCTYAIGRSGHVVDLTDPTQPERVANWRDHVEDDDYMHDFTEVAPGRVMGAGQPSFYLDMTDPLNPVELAWIDPGFHSLGYHGAAWPNGATDPILLMGAEVAPEGLTNLAGSDCTDTGVYAVATYDATDVLKLDAKQFGPQAERGQRTGHDKQRARTTFVKLHEWRVEGSGLYLDGNAPFHTLFCGHWFDPHPQWDAGGVLALTHYDWGTRFLDVHADGSMEEVGWFQPVEGYTGSAKWITDEIVYVHDYRRGLEILRFTDAPG